MLYFLQQIKKETLKQCADYYDDKGPGKESGRVKIQLGNDINKYTIVLKS